jgi:hypothetical protein
MPATRGVTTAFTLNPNTPVQLSLALPDPDGRLYVLITNNDKSNAVAFAHNTGNQATAQHHVIPPGSFYEFRFKPVSGGYPFPEKSWGLVGDISAIAVSGSPQISYLEL